MTTVKKGLPPPNELEMKLCWHFTGAAIDATPDEPGVFAFFSETGGLILLGSAAKSLRGIFRSHWKGFEGGETCGAAYIGWEPSKNPMAREAELVALYAKKFGRLPRRQTR
jgi:hypothetical protein